MSLKNTVSKIKKEEVLRVEQDKLNQEMIAYQNDKPFIDAAAKCIEDIVAVCGTVNSNLSSKEGLKAIKAFEDLLTKRFGIRFIVGNNTINNAWCIPNCRAIDSAGGHWIDFRKTFDRYEKIANSDEWKKAVEKDINIDEQNVRDVKSMWEAMTGGNYVKQLSDLSYYNFLDKVAKDGYTMDLKNAKIINPNKNQFFYINVDFYTFSAVNKMTSLELLGIIMHEIGHGWSELERTYLVYNNIFMLNDIIQEEYAKKNKTATEAIKIFYKKSQLSEPNKIPKGITEVVIQATGEIMRGSNVANDTNQGLSNHEQMADEFASRFGLGTYVITGLQKMGLEPKYDERQINVMERITQWGSISLTVGGALLQSGIGTMLVGGALPLLIGGLFFYSALRSFYSKGTIYDTMQRRYQRARNTTIRRLANITDPEVKKYILTQLEDNAVIMAKVNEYYNRGLRGLIAKWAQKANNVAYQEYALAHLIEDLNANEIHVASALWNTK